MTSSGPPFDNQPSPLETPGRIGIIGGGMLGIEAALYGRYLGYKVDVFEAGSIGQRAIRLGDQPLPLLPDRSFSPLAAAALSAQSDDRPATLPMTHQAWAEQILVPLCQTDLLRGRVHEQARVTAILPEAEEEDREKEKANVAVDSSGHNAVGDDDADVPPDFQIVFEDGRPDEVVEALIVAIDDDDAVNQIEWQLSTTAAYLFRIRRGDTADAEANFALGLKQIVSVYANLADRADLDLYAPRRG